MTETKREQFNDALEKLGWTPEVAGHNMKVSSRTVRRYMNGDTKVPYLALYFIKEQLNEKPI